MCIRDRETIAVKRIKCPTPIFSLRRKAFKFETLFECLKKDLLPTILHIRIKNNSTLKFNTYFLNVICLKKKDTLKLYQNQLSSKVSELLEHKMYADLGLFAYG